MWAAQLLSLLVVGLLAVAGVNSETCVPDKCIIVQNCRCAITGPQTPGRLSVRGDIPQFVTLTFQGPITPMLDTNLRKIFNEERKNADGCLQKATFFVPGKKGGNDWKAVRDWYKQGHEIGSYSNSYKTNQEYWRTIDRKTMKEEAKDIKVVLKDEADIPPEKVRGWRTPMLEFGGDVMMKALRDSGFEYDSSLKISGQNKIWPFTMDHGWPFMEACRKYTNACIKNSYKGFWEFPVITHENKNDGSEMATFAKIMDDNPENIFKIMKDSFQEYYTGGRAPFMMTFTTTYFAGDYASIRVKALQKFLTFLTEQPDVHVTTLYDMLQWIKHPKTASDMRDHCKTKKVEIEGEKLPEFNHLALSRRDRFLYYYGQRAHGSRTELAYLTLLLPLAAVLVKYL